MQSSAVPKYNWPDTVKAEITTHFLDRLTWMIRKLLDLHSVVHMKSARNSCVKNEQEAQGNNSAQPPHCWHIAAWCGCGRHICQFQEVAGAVGHSPPWADVRQVSGVGGKLSDHPASTADRMLWQLWSWTLSGFSFLSLVYVTVNWICSYEDSVLGF